MTTTKEKPPKNELSAVDTALAEVHRLVDAERAQPERQLQARQELHAAKQIGDWSQASALTAEIEHLADAGEVRDRRRVAIIEYHLAKAVDLRQQAETLRSDAQAMETAKAPLLAQLRELEGVAFVAHLPRWQEQARGVDYRPRSEQITDAADELDRKARELERHPQAKDSGTAEGVGVDGIIEAVFAKPGEMAPSIPAIREWAAARPAGRLTLAWRNGRIV